MTALAAVRPQQTWGLTVLGALALSGVLAVSAHASVPFWPVPMTLQPLAVLAIAGLAGPRLAVAAYLAYLIEGAFGLPVFSGTPARGIGLAYMAGPTGGYLAGQLMASGLVAWGIEKFGRRPMPVVASMVAGMAVIYALGLAWLSQFVPGDQLLAVGVLPFLAGDAVKVALAATLVLALRRVRG